MSLNSGYSDGDMQAAARLLKQVFGYGAFRLQQEQIEIEDDVRRKPRLQTGIHTAVCSQTLFEKAFFLFMIWAFSGRTLTQTEQIMICKINVNF